MAENIIQNLHICKLEYKQNSTLREAILQQPEASHWSPEDYTKNQWYTITVPENSSEYETIRAKIRRHYSDDPFPILKIDRIQNPFMLGQFLLKREKMSEEIPLMNTRMLFHGTTKEALNGICENNFDWKLCRGSKYGHGVSFSPYPRYANYYGEKYGTRVMIVAHVLVGELCIGYQDMKLPAEGCDTATRDDEAVIVKFEEDEFYPAYVVHYQW